VASDFETLVTLVETTLGDDSIAFGVFRLAESRKDAVRKTIWIPTEFICRPVLMSNPLIDADTGEMGDSLFTDFLTVECQISGTNFEDACDIRKKICNAVRRAMGVSSIPTNGVYQTEMSGHSSVMWNSYAKIVQLFEWQINVPKTETYSTVVTTIDQAGDLTLDGVTSTEELLTITAP
jgi:hypothetical protein